MLRRASHLVGSQQISTIMRLAPSLSATALLTSWSWMRPRFGWLSSQTISSGPLTHQIRPTSALLSKRAKKPRNYELDDALEMEDCLGSAVEDFATAYHSPVMVEECIDALLSCDRSAGTRIFVDGTLGGGGHSAALLAKLSPGDVVVGCDVDPEALETASERLKEYMNHDGHERPLFVPVESNFCRLEIKLPTIRHAVTEKPILPDGVVDGILLDLGVSSHQIDTAARGFAYLKDGPLDMRMGATIQGGFTAADLLNEFSEVEIRRILKQYGDEPRAKGIAASIVRHRPFSTTKDLVAAVSAVVPEFCRKSRRMGRPATLARVFQSLRIVVNREDLVLEQALMEMCPALVRPGGRLVVLSYHSMEDRATKRVIRDGTIGVKSTIDRDLFGNYIGTPRPWKSVGKARKASHQEVELNSRARSATLRVGERLHDSNVKF